MVKFGDHFVARGFCVQAAENFERAIAREIRGLAGRPLDGRCEFGVKTQAFYAERYKRRRFGRIRTWREHSSRGPGGFAPGLLAIEHGHAQFFGGKLESNRAADQSAANDEYVVSAHRLILSGIAARTLLREAASESPCASMDRMRISQLHFTSEGINEFDGEEAGFLG